LAICQASNVSSFSLFFDVIDTWYKKSVLFYRGENMTDAIIVSGGSGSTQLLKHFLDSYNNDLILIAADRGLSYLTDIGVIPDYIVGDFDSAGEELLKYAMKLESDGVSKLTRLNPIKDDTDTESALNIAFRECDGDIYILFGTGNRLDHVISNIQILKQGLIHNRNVYLIDSNNKIRVIDPRHPITIEKSKQYGDFISVFPLSGTVTGLNLDGFCYPLKNAVLESGISLGQSNEISSDHGSISVSSGELIVVESRD
jgi:thiamine pyrophosphokinase